MMALLLLGAPSGSAQEQPALVAHFEQQVKAALGQRDGAALKRLVAFLSPREASELLAAPAGKLGVVTRALGPVGAGTLVFLRVEKTETGTPGVFQALCELRRVGQRTVAVRRVPLAEAARNFRIAAHRSAMRIEAETGATEMGDEIEIGVVRPTRWIFFLLDPEREVRSVAIEAKGAEVFYAGNFVALERGVAWSVGERVKIEVRSRLRLVRKKMA